MLLRRIESVEVWILLVERISIPLITKRLKLTDFQRSLNIKQQIKLVMNL